MQGLDKTFPLVAWIVFTIADINNIYLLIINWSKTAWIGNLTSIGFVIFYAFLIGIFFQMWYRGLNHNQQQTLSSQEVEKIFSGAK